MPDKSGGLVSACSKNIVVFSEFMLGVRLYAWQVQFLNKIQEEMSKPEGEREFVAITSRQIGKSTALAIFSLWCAIFNKYPGTVSNATYVGIASASDVQAKKLLYEMKKFVRLGDRTMYVKYHEKMQCGETFFSDLLDDHEPNNTTTITFKPYNEQKHGDFILKGSNSGSTIKSYPPTSSVLGETFSIVIIDEAGKSDKITDQFFYDYMYPTGNSTNAIRIYTSTPWVSSGFFYRMVDPDDVFTETPANTVTYTIDAIRIEAPKYYSVVMKIVSQLNADGKTNEVQRAYYCRFVKGELSFFDPIDVLDVFKPDITKMYRYLDCCDLGIDFGGQRKSRTVLTLSTLNDNDEIIRIWDKVYEVGHDNTIIEDIENEILPYFNVQRMIPEECPQGDFIIRKMKDKGWDVHEMNPRTDKVKKYTSFRAKLKRGQIKSYLDDELKTEMLALETNTGSKQSIIEHAPGYNDDRIDSWVLSCRFYLLEDTGIKTFDFTQKIADANDGCTCGSLRLERDNEYIKCLECGRRWESI